MTSPQVAAPALPPRHRTPSPQPPLDAASSPQTTAPVATTGLAPAAAASPSKISSLKQVAAAKQLATKMSDRAIAAANDMNLHVPTVKEVLAFSPVKHAYKTLKPFIVNEDGRLGEDTPEAKRRSLERIQFVSTWLDAKYKVPFTKYKIGVDPIVSAIPMVGDVISTALSCYIVYLTRRFHVPWIVTAKMVWNVMLNASFGAIPIVGSMFDVAYKPNMRNLILLEEYLRDEAIKSGKDPKHIDAALKKARAEVISLHDPGETYNSDGSVKEPLLSKSAEPVPMRTAM